jgi:general secretion pathway protein G
LEEVLVHEGVKNAGRFLWLLVAAQAIAVAVGSSVLFLRPKLPTARFAAAHYDMSGRLKTALEAFRADCGRYPTTREGLQVLIDAPAKGFVEQWYGPYFGASQLPEDPWGRQYVYRFPATRSANAFDLYSFGPDGVSKSGGNDADDINNWDSDSPRQTSYPDTAVIAFALLVPAPLCYGARLLGGLFSSRVRALVAANPGAERAWLLIALIALVMMLCAISPRL